MTTPHHRSSLTIEERNPEELRAAIEKFLSGCTQPAALEFGELPIPLIEGQYALEIRSGWLSIEIWVDKKSVSRRIVDVSAMSTGILDCMIHKFGNKPSRLTFLDLARPQTAHRRMAGGRQNFAEQFRRMLARQFPGWEIKTLTAAQDLRRSFSGVYPRAHLSKNRQHVAAVACAEPLSENELLAYALIWHRHVRQQYDVGGLTKLALFLPQGCGNQTAHRLHWLNKQSLPATIYLFNEHGSAGAVDPADLGNLQTAVATQPAQPPSAEQVSTGPPEKWLETVVRSSIQVIDPFLRRNPVHSQVLTLAGLDRDLIDLLAVTNDGRLCVLELKVNEEVQLPIQALDYWMRIYWHARRQELNHLFPGIALRDLAPRLILLAPAIKFHSTSATLLSYFSSQIEVERIGVNLEWREHLRVVLRLQGAESPISQQL